METKAVDSPVKPFKGLGGPFERHVLAKRKFSSCLKVSRPF